MPKADDPYYSRKPVPTEFVKDVGFTGLSSEEEHATREKKLIVDGVDVRRFSNSKKHYDDPYYGRKPVDAALTSGVGDTGLSAEEELENRERKYSVGGVDVRRFRNSKDHYDDPYYGRKAVPAAKTIGVGETGMDQAEEYEVRERKQSMFQLSDDPFAIATGTGHRQSVSAGVSGAAAEARRRSSAVGPHASAATANHNAHQGSQLEPIESRPELPPVNAGGGLTNDHAPHTTTTTTTNTTTNTNVATGGHTNYYESATHHDPDSVAPDERR